MDAKPSALDIIHQALARLAENADPQARGMKGFLEEYKSLLRGADTDARKAILTVARMLYNQAANLDYDIGSNGEASVIAACCAKNSVVFDVGANRGDWSKAVLSQCPEARIHCFEIVPATARLLADALADAPNASVNPCGLSDSPGMVTVHHYPEHSELSGIYRMHDDHDSEAIQCKTTTGDNYCLQKNIGHIRLLKIDCEGAEFNVLKGFIEMIRGKRIDAIQFEYGKANIMARTLLLDLYNFLKLHGYAIGKIYPTGVDFKPYEFTDEDFVGPNYLACLKSDPELMAALATF